MCDTAVVAAEHHVGDAGAFAARQPRGDEGVGGVQVRVDPQWTAAQENRDHRYAGGLQRAQQGQVRTVVCFVLEVRSIALELRVGSFAEHHDRNIGALRETAVDDQFDAAACRGDGGPNAVVDRSCPGKVRVAVAGALPGQRPAAGLAADVVGPVTGHQHP